MKKTNPAILTKFLVIIFFCFFLGSLAYAQNLPVTGKERSARIDIYSEGKKFNLTPINTNGKFWNPTETREASPWWITDLSLNQENKWQELWIEFTPTVSGAIFIELRGSNYPDLKINRHEVFFDDVKIEGAGAEIKNGSFEKVDLKGNPVDWGYTGSSENMCNTGGIEARTGKSCVLVWHDSPVIQRVAVRAGDKYRITAWSKPVR